ncbi:hypothetical protein EDI_070580 [Entamoeba dispar SAW760]|uniref:Uncharacterized protein n=1 Tax=Entamoeba dispar (strain ATCC PRA-260 / SAW760) TaxID=370354 RepID=B0EM98_ENTDS|nr:uncharacterized protein EDI_070580 [Entamoeba dispar SAW760]EDR24316.1 hypothetical protein EDI_070580 [Entamoeba dispar SAW760]|eukprot:EDR24316.1 hypothetical protein EDI_070580 [Entamoeba dispar SAW760]
MSTLNLVAPPYIPKKRQPKTSGGTNGSTNKSIGETRARTNVSTNLSQQSSTGVSQHSSSTSTNPSHPQQNAQTLYKQLLYWEPKDANGSVLDEAYCIECIPSDFWQRLGDLNDTIKSFEKYFNTSLMN